MATAHYHASLLSFKPNQIHSLDEDDLASFHLKVAGLFRDLSTNDLLSIKWTRKLLDSFVIIQEEFQIILVNHSAHLARPLMADFFDRTIKALDVLNAVRDGIEQMRHWRKHLDIVLTALGHGQVRRASKALADLSVMMLDNRDALFREFNFRSLAWSFSRSWSASSLIQAMASNLTAPRGTQGLANIFYAMSSVILLVSTVLVAAIPCQERGILINFSIPRSFPWSGPVIMLYGRILDESKKRDRKESSGLLREIQQIEKCACRLMDLIDKNQFDDQMKREVDELVEVCEYMKDGLDPLECQVREVFHRIVRSRTEGLNLLSSQD